MQGRKEKEKLTRPGTNATKFAKQKVINIVYPDPSAIDIHE
jgi:hypothetical protein